jgi:hypothetical protein
MRLAIIGLTLACAAVLPCAAAVHKCTDGKGKVTYQDGPCREAQPQGTIDTSDAVAARGAGKAAAASAAGTITASLPAGDDADYRSAKGAWRGPAQFHFVANGARAADAQAPAPMVIELQADGRVQGTINEAGCKVSGLTTQVASPASVSIDVMLSGCRDARFNGRFNGFLNTSAAAKEATLQLTALAMSAGAGKATQSSLDAVLKR